jgi:hypothetical protein
MLFHREIDKEAEVQCIILVKVEVRAGSTAEVVDVRGEGGFLYGATRYETMLKVKGRGVKGVRCRCRSFFEWDAGR